MESGRPIVSTNVASSAIWPPSDGTLDSDKYTNEFLPDSIVVRGRRLEPVRLEPAITLGLRRRAINADERCLGGGKKGADEALPRYEINWSIFSSVSPIDA